MTHEGHHTGVSKESSERFIGDPKGDISRESRLTKRFTPEEGKETP